jgi:hypothetical protein
MTDDNSDRISRDLKAFSSFILTIKQNPYASFFAVLIILLLMGSTIISYYAFVKIKNLEQIEENGHVSQEELQADLEKTVRNHDLVSEQLNNLLIETSADRAFVTRFHNSYTDVAGKHFYYFSITNEVTSPGTSRVIDDMQYQHISKINSCMKQFILGECNYFNVVDMADESKREGFEDRGIKAVANCPVYDIDKLYLQGFVGVHYVKNELPEDLDIEDIEHSALLITGILS